MRRSGLFSALAVLGFLPLAGAQPGLTCKGGRCSKVISGVAPVRSQLRVNTHGPVTFEGGASGNLSYTVTVTVNARSEAEARRLLQRYNVRTVSEGLWTVFTAPGGAAM